MWISGKCWRSQRRGSGVGYMIEFRHTEGEGKKEKGSGGVSFGLHLASQGHILLFATNSAEIGVQPKHG